MAMGLFAFYSLWEEHRPLFASKSQYFRLIGATYVVTVLNHLVAKRDGSSDRHVTPRIYFVLILVEYLSSILITCHVYSWVTATPCGDYLSQISCKSSAKRQEIASECNKVDDALRRARRSSVREFKTRFLPGRVALIPLLVFSFLTNASFEDLVIEICVAMVMHRFYRAIIGVNPENSYMAVIFLTFIHLVWRPAISGFYFPFVEAGEAKPVNNLYVFSWLQTLFFVICVTVTVVCIEGDVSVTSVLRKVLTAVREKPPRKKRLDVFSGSEEHAGEIYFDSVEHSGTVLAEPTLAIPLEVDLIDPRNAPLREHTLYGFSSKGYYTYPEDIQCGIDLRGIAPVASADRTLVTWSLFGPYFVYRQGEITFEVSMNLLCDPRYFNFRPLVHPPSDIVVSPNRDDLLVSYLPTLERKALIAHTLTQGKPIVELQKPHEVAPGTATVIGYGKFWSVCEEAKLFERALPVLSTCEVFNPEDEEDCKRKDLFIVSDGTFWRIVPNALFARLTGTPSVIWYVPYSPIGPRLQKLRQKFEEHQALIDATRVNIDVTPILESVSISTNYSQTFLNYISAGMKKASDVIVDVVEESNCFNRKSEVALTLAFGNLAVAWISASDLDPHNRLINRASSLASCLTSILEAKDVKRFLTYFSAVAESASVGIEEHGITDRITENTFVRNLSNMVDEFISNGRVTEHLATAMTLLLTGPLVFNAVSKESSFVDAMRRVSKTLRETTSVNQLVRDTSYFMSAIVQAVLPSTPEEQTLYLDFARVSKYGSDIELSTEPLDLHSMMLDLNNVIGDFEQEVRKKGKTVTWFTEKLARLYIVQQSLGVAIKACKKRFDPFVTTFVGSSAVGKSHLVECLIPVANHLDGIKYEIPAVIQGASKYANQVTNSTTSIYFDDFGFVRPDVVPDIAGGTLQALFAVTGNNMIPVDKAEIEAKGKICFTGRSIFISSNGLDSFAALAERKTAVYRRCGFISEIRFDPDVLEEVYGDPNYDPRNIDREQLKDYRGDDIIPEYLQFRTVNYVETNRIVKPVYSEWMRSRDWFMLWQKNRAEHMRRQRYALSQMNVTVKSCKECNGILPSCSCVCKKCECPKYQCDCFHVLEHAGEEAETDHASYVRALFTRWEKLADFYCRQYSALVSSPAFWILFLFACGVLRHWLDVVPFVLVAMFVAGLALYRVADAKVKAAVLSITSTIDGQMATVRGFRQLCISTMLAVKPYVFALAAVSTGSWIYKTMAEIRKAKEVQRDAVTRKAVFDIIAQFVPESRRSQAAETYAEHAGISVQEVQEAWRRIDCFTEQNREPPKPSVRRTITLDQLRRKVRNQLYGFVLESFQNGSPRLATGNILFIRSGYALMNYHYFRGFSPSEEFKITLRRPTGIKFTEHSNMTHVYRIPGKDLVVLSLGIGNEPSDLTDYLAPNDDWEGAVGRLDRLREEMTYGDFPITVTPCQYYGNDDEPLSGCSYHIIGGSRAGFCGSVMTVENDGEKFILGLHRGGSPNSTLCHGATLTRTEFDAAFESLKSFGMRSHPSPYLSDKGVTIHPESIAAKIHGDNVIVVGTGVNMSTPRCTMKEHPNRKAFEEAFGMPCDKFPAKMSKKAHHDNILPAVAPTFAYNTKSMKLAVDDYASELINIIKISKEYGEALLIDRPLTVREIVEGIPNNPRLNGLNMKTSTGWPFYRGKREYIQKTEEEDILFHENLVELIGTEYANAKKGYRTQVPFTASLKNEVLKAGKDPRQFYAASTPYHMVCASILSAVQTVFLSFPVQSESFAGCNPLGPEAQKLFELINKFGGERIIAGDYKKMDKTLGVHTKLAVRLAYEVVARELFEDEGMVELMCTVFDSCIMPGIVIEGNTLIVPNLNPSGTINTVQLNGIGISLLARYHLEEDFQLLSEWKTMGKSFRDFCSIITMGDDHLWALSAKVPKEVNNIWFAEREAKFGRTYTSPDKVSPLEEFYVLETAEFCQRFFRFFPPIDRHLMAYPWRKFRNAICFHDAKLKGVALQQRTLETLRSMRTEAVPWGEEEYLECIKVCERIIEIDGLPRPSWLTMSFAEAVADIFSEAAPVQESVEASSEMPPLYDPSLFDPSLLDDEINVEGERALPWFYYVGNDGEIPEVSEEDTIERPEDQEYSIYGSDEGVEDVDIGFMMQIMLQDDDEDEIFDPEEEDEDPPIFEEEWEKYLSFRATERYLIVQQALAQGSLAIQEEHSEEVSTDPVADVTTDTPVEVANTPSDPFEHVTKGDGTLPSDFFSREIVYKTVQAQQGVFFEKFFPFTEFLSHNLIAPRITTHTQLRGTVRVRVKFSCTPGHYGSVRICSYPGELGNHIRDWLVDPAISNDFKIAAVTAAANGIIFLPEETEYIVEVPIYTRHGAIDLTALEQSGATVCISTVAAIQHTVSDEEVTMMIYLSMPHCQLYGASALMTEDAGDHPVGAISGTLSAMADVAEFAQTLPLPWSIPAMVPDGLRAGSALAALSGFSRPIDVSMTHAITTEVGRMSCYNAPEIAFPMGVDAVNQVMFGPHIPGDEPDPMNILQIAMKKSYIGSFTWKASDAQDTTLASIVVNPMTGMQDDTRRLLSNLAYVSNLFRYWHGSIVYTFEIVASPYHKGQIALYFDPLGDGGNVANYAALYKSIITVGQMTTVEFAVPWASPEFLKPVRFPSALVGIDSQRSISVSDNGMLTCKVVQPLMSSVPGTATRPVLIAMYVSAGKDFLPGIPRYPNRTSLLTPDYLPLPSYTTGDPPVVVVEPAPNDGAVPDTGERTVPSCAEKCSDKRTRVGRRICTRRCEDEVVGIFDEDRQRWGTRTSSIPTVQGTTGFEPRENPEPYYGVVSDCTLECGDVELPFVTPSAAPVEPPPAPAGSPTAAEAPTSQPWWRPTLTPFRPSAPTPGTQTSEPTISPGTAAPTNDPSGCDYVPAVTMPFNLQQRDTFAWLHVRPHWDAGDYTFNFNTRCGVGEILTYKDSTSELLDTTVVEVEGDNSVTITVTVSVHFSLNWLLLIKIPRPTTGDVTVDHVFMPSVKARSRMYTGLPPLDNWYGGGQSESLVDGVRAITVRNRGILRYYASHAPCVGGYTGIVVDYIGNLRHNGVGYSSTTRTKALLYTRSDGVLDLSAETAGTAHIFEISYLTSPGTSPSRNLAEDMDIINLTSDSTYNLHGSIRRGMFGEGVANLRALLKRYCLSYTFTGTNGNIPMYPVDLNNWHTYILSAYYGVRGGYRIKLFATAKRPQTFTLTVSHRVGALQTTAVERAVIRDIGQLTIELPYYGIRRFEELRRQSNDILWSVDPPVEITLDVYYGAAEDTTGVLYQGLVTLQK